jgi:uroporphyrinogen-III decarboxylase
MSFFLASPPDFAAHNAEVRAVWEAYHAGRPSRVPVSLSGSLRNFLQNPALNDTGYSFRDFFEDPEAQIQCQLRYQRWVRYHLLCDREMGPPREGWPIGIDFQNSLDASWFGCPVFYQGNHVPDTREILKNEPLRLYDLDCPDPLRSGLMGRAVEFYDYMQQRCPQLEFEGLPVLPPTALPGEGSDGVLDAAYKLRGAAEVCLDLVADPDYFHDLLGFLTDCLIRRMKAVREWRWARQPEAPDRGQFRRPGYGWADDAIVLLSVAQYREHVLPYHRRFVEEFSDGSPTAVHLCGDAQRFFPLLRDELHVQSFDTGFPVDFARLRSELGPTVQFNGGPTVMLTKSGPPEAIRAEVRRICASGIMVGGKFILIAANNLSPCTPLEHTNALYAAAKEFGRY